MTTIIHVTGQFTEFDVTVADNGDGTGIATMPLLPGMDQQAAFTAIESRGWLEEIGPDGRDLTFVDKDGQEVTGMLPPGTLMRVPVRRLGTALAQQHSEQTAVSVSTLRPSRASAARSSGRN